jgi:hypothetical protein
MRKPSGCGALVEQCRKDVGRAHGADQPPILVDDCYRDATGAGREGGSEVSSNAELHELLA